MKRILRACAVLTALVLPALAAGTAGASPPTSTSPVVTIDSGAVRGTAVTGGYAFRGIPYAAAPTGNLRWRPPQPAAGWRGVRDAGAFAPNCPQPASPFTPDATSEDCLYLNVSTPTVRAGGHPVLVWIHGGGFSVGAGRDYDPAKLAAAGTVVVTVNYRLGALGFLAHPALAARPGGPAGNYGLMDQQAALRWVQRNIRQFGGDPRNVTIAGQSAGGLSVLDHLISPRSRGLFQRAIVQSGAFALKQQSLAAAEATGTAYAAAAGCADQSADCLRRLPVSYLADHSPGVLIPGVVDGGELKESLGTALAAGRFARVPIVNGTNHDEERLFLALGSSVSGGTSIPFTTPVTAANYQSMIGTAFGVPAAKAAAIAAEYPLGAYDSPEVAFSQLDTDANFSCSALQVDRWTAARVPTYAYDFVEDASPERYVPQIALPTKATHQTELQYLFDLPPNATVPGALNADQQVLSAAMRADWASFAAVGRPGWPTYTARGRRVVSLVAPRPAVSTDFAARHHCGFWSTAL